jgi:hypothetical protein|tara:strand:+ start:812 stop:925 length:114 start_codon:yes stop_codon:yes gene_type:complete
LPQQLQEKSQAKSLAFLFLKISDELRFTARKFEAPTA